MTTRGEVALPKDKPRFRDLQIQGNRDTRAHSHTHSLKLARARTHARINLILKTAAQTGHKISSLKLARKERKKLNIFFTKGVI